MEERKQSEEEMATGKRRNKGNRGTREIAKGGKRERGKERERTKKI